MEVTKNRFAGLPQVESLVQAGYKNLDLQFWHALFAPAATPRPVIDRLNSALRQSFGNAKVQEAFVKNGMELYPASEQTPEVATALLKSEITRWGGVIRANKIEVQAIARPRRQHAGRIVEARAAMLG